MNVPLHTGMFRSVFYVGIIKYNDKQKKIMIFISGVNLDPKPKVEVDRPSFLVLTIYNIFDVCFC